jgi:hypothetical protein
MPKDIGKFIFLETQEHGVTGAIDGGDSVELRFCDRENNPIGQGKRNRNDKATLAVELY